MVTFQSTAVFFLAWMLISTLGFISLLDSTGSDNFTNITESAFSVEGVNLDNPPIGNTGNGITTIISLPKTTGDWIGNVAKSATFNSPIWDGGFSNIIRVVLATIGGAYLFVLIIKGLEILANIIPG